MLVQNDQFIHFLFHLSTCQRAQGQIYQESNQFLFEVKIQYHITFFQAFRPKKSALTKALKTTTTYVINSYFHANKLIASLI